MNNLEIYNKVKAVPDNACKAFDNGRFKGTDINSMWRIKVLTELFGPVGIGWTIRTIRTWLNTASNNEVLAFAEVGIKIKVDGQWSEEWTAIGGNKMVSYSKKNDALTNSDESFKMAVTDAFGNACKYLGIGADIYWANDVSKYTENQHEEPATNYDRLKALYNRLDDAGKQIIINKIKMTGKTKFADLDLIQQQEILDYAKSLI